MDKRVPAEAFPSFQEKEFYALFAHLLTMTSEKGHRNIQSRYRFATHGRCASGWLFQSGGELEHQKKRWCAGYCYTRGPIV